MRLSQFEFTACSTAAWENENTLCIWLRPLEAIGQRHIRFIFSGNKVIVHAGGVPDGESTMQYLAGFVGFFLKPAIVVKAARLLLSKGRKAVEPRHTGRMKV